MPTHVRTRPHVYAHGSGAHEAINKILCQCAVDLGRADRLALEPVEPRVDDVDVEAVLV